MANARRLLVVALALPSLAACADGRHPAAPVPRAAPAPAAQQTSAACHPGTRNRLERAASGLLYMSESDYPFEYFCRPASVGDTLTLDEFRSLSGEGPAVPIEEISVDEFFARHIERIDPNDPVAVLLAPRYQALKQTIYDTLAEPRVYRAGSIAIRCYVVGTDEWGNLAGLTTVAIET